jgi:hypothetical protein
MHLQQLVAFVDMEVGMGVVVVVVDVAVVVVCAGNMTWPHTLSCTATATVPKVL